MKITFIKVSMMDGKGYDAMKPLIFPIIESLTPKEIDVEYIDERIEEIPEIIDSDIIALSVETFAARRAYNIAKKYKTDEVYQNQVIEDGIGGYNDLQKYGIPIETVNSGIINSGAIDQLVKTQELYMICSLIA